MKPSFAFAERVLFFVLLALQLVPLWSVHYFLTGDGPCHLYNAKVLLDFFQGGEAKSFFSSWMFVNTALEPNWFSHATMSLLMGLGTPPFLAEKLLQTFYVLAFGLGLRFMIRQLNPNALFLSTFGLLLTYHHVFQMGFYNYSCSLAIMFWTTGYWLKHRQDWNAGRMLGLGLGFVLLYFCHPIGLLLSFLMIGGVFLAELSNQVFRKKPVMNTAQTWRYFGKKCAFLADFCFAGIALVCRIHCSERPERFPAKRIQSPYLGGFSGAFGTVYHFENGTFLGHWHCHTVFANGHLGYPI
jgi:hypothetical protein